MTQYVWDKMEEHVIVKFMIENGYLDSEVI